MRPLRLALAQMNPTVGDLEGNTNAVLALLDEAKSRGAHIAVFPELAVTGYPPEDLLLRPQFLADAKTQFDRIVEASRWCGGGGGRARAGGRTRVQPRCGVEARRGDRQAVQRRGCGGGRPSRSHLSQDLLAQLRGVRRGAVLPAWQRVSRVRDQRGAGRRQRLRGHLVRRGPEHGPARGRRRGHRQHQRLALPPGQGPPARGDARGAGPDSRRLHRVPQHRWRAGRARVRRPEPRARA